MFLFVFAILNLMNQPPKILVVDDEGYFREIFSTKLLAAGYNVETAENGVEAISKVALLKPDLVMMDVRMPEMDGVQAVMKLKEDPATKDTKIVFLTSFGESEEALQAVNVKFAKDIGAIGYIKKSEDLDTMAAKVKEYLGA